MKCILARFKSASPIGVIMFQPHSQDIILATYEFSVHNGNERFSNCAPVRDSNV